ncbi:hypothetical protein, partial [Desulfovibrio sp. SGI.169]|uniref:hypothetical protein n=1 Tax=Desulfovibrio sp. SGI.169 TaxID=3420561 RepID=UPI003CFF4728
MKKKDLNPQPLRWLKPSLLSNMLSLFIISRACAQRLTFTARKSTPQPAATVPDTLLFVRIQDLARKGRWLSCRACPGRTGVSLGRNVARPSGSRSRRQRQDARQVLEKAEQAPSPLKDIEFFSIRLCGKTIFPPVMSSFFRILNGPIGWILFSDEFTKNFHGGMPFQP